MATQPLLERRGTPLGAWLRPRRLRLALLVGAVETVAIVFTDTTWRFAVLAALAVFAFHAVVGRRARSDAVRQVSWTAAASQVLPLVVPVLVFIVGTLLVLAVVALALAMLVLLLRDRR